MGALTRDAQLLGHMGDRSTLLDPLDQNPPAVKCQTSITVGHEDLRTVEDFDISTAPGGLHYVNNPNGVSPTSWPSTASR